MSVGVNSAAAWATKYSSVKIKNISGNLLCFGLKRLAFGGDFTWCYNCLFLD